MVGAILDPKEVGWFKDLPITRKEVLPVVLALAWAIVEGSPGDGAHCDNEAAVAVLNSGYSQEQQIMHLL